MDTEREISSISREDGSKWRYPSEAMFYQAVWRKHQKSIPQSDLSSIVRIHNQVNEETWRRIRQWEGLDETDNNQLCLLRFVGRPNDCSPKAMWKWLVAGWKPPFDRHDWWIQRHDGSIARYVIDYYSAGSDAIFIDARPALDSVYSIRMRLKSFYSNLTSQYLN